MNTQAISLFYTHTHVYVKKICLMLSVFVVKPQKQGIVTFTLLCTWIVGGLTLVLLQVFCWRNQQWAPLRNAITSLSLTLTNIIPCVSPNANQGNALKEMNYCNLLTLQSRRERRCRSGKTHCTLGYGVLFYMCKWRVYVKRKCDPVLVTSYWMSFLMFYVL